MHIFGNSVINKIPAITTKYRCSIDLTGGSGSGGGSKTIRPWDRDISCGLSGRIQILNNNLRVMVITNNSLISDKIQSTLSDQGLSFTICKSGDEAFETMKQKRFDMIFTTRELPGNLDGLRMIKTVRKLFSREIPVIMIMDKDDQALQEKATKANGDASRFHFLFTPLEDPRSIIRLANNNFKRGYDSNLYIRI